MKAFGLVLLLRGAWELWHMTLLQWLGKCALIKNLTQELVLDMIVSTKPGYEEKDIIHFEALRLRKRLHKHMDQQSTLSAPGRQPAHQIQVQICSYPQLATFHLIA